MGTEQYNNIEAQIKQMLDSEEEVSLIDEFVEEHEDEYDGDLAEFAFRAAVGAGHMEYVEEHIDDVELNDEDGYSSYLYETDDEDMIELLMDHGAFKSMDDYVDCRFAYESVNGYILAFNADFQKEVFEKYKEVYQLTNKKILALLEDGDCDIDDRDLEQDLSTMGVDLSDGEIKFEDKYWVEGGSDLQDLLEELGWECEFEGDSWKLETTGVYFID